MNNKNESNDFQIMVVLYGYFNDIGEGVKSYVNLGLCTTEEEANKQFENHLDVGGWVDEVILTEPPNPEDPPQVLGCFKDNGEGKELQWESGVCISEPKAKIQFNDELKNGAWIGKIDIYVGDSMVVKVKDISAEKDEG